MNISNQTINVLKNFATINQSLYFQPGSKLRTVSPQKTVLSEVIISENIEREFGIYDLNQFLAALGLFTSPSLDLKDHHMVISDESGSKTKYHYADKSMIVTPPDKNLSLPDVSVEFDLSNEVLNKIQQSARVLNAPELIVTVEDGEIAIEAGDSKNSSVNTFKTPLGTTDSNDCRHVFKLDNIKMMMLDYTVTISSKGIAQFKTADDRVTYFVATETKG